MTNYLKPLMYYIPLLILQLVVVPLISIYGIVPNLIIILVIYYTLFGGQVFGMVLGFALGLFFDLFSGGVIGASMLAMTVSAFVCGYFFNENRVDVNLASYFFLVILFIGAFVESVIYSATGNFNPDAGITVLLLEGALLPAIYTTVFGVGVVVFNSRKARL